MSVACKEGLEIEHDHRWVMYLVHLCNDHIKEGERTS